MAPEVLQGEPLSPKSDQYSLACVAAEALVGYELTDAFIKTSYEPNLQETRKLPTSWPTRVPWQVRIALERALSNDPNSRYSTVSEFVGAPEALTIRVEQTPETRTQWEAETRARQDAAEQSRLQAEEQARLAALEQARRELQEELQQVTHERQEDSGESAPPESQKQLSPPPSSDSTTKFHKLWRKWLVWIFIGALVMVLVGLLLLKSFSGNGLFHLTDTPTFPPIIPTLTLTETGTPTTILTPSQTLTRSPTETTTKTSRQTWTHTPIHTPTHTSTPIQNPYPYRPLFRERTPPEINPSH